MTQANYDAGNYSDTSGDTAATYCENLTLGGYEGCLLPISKQLESLADYGRYAPAIDPIFQNIVSSYYWSAKTYEDSPQSAWNVGFNSGGDAAYAKDFSTYVCCVRSGQ